MFVVSAIASIGMLVFAARSSLQESELSGQQTQEIASLKQRIADLKKTVNRQSQVIERLSNEPISISDDQPAEEAYLFRSQKQREMGAGKIVALDGCTRVA